MTPAEEAQLLKRVEELEKRVNYPIPFEMQEALEYLQFKTLRMDKIIIDKTVPVPDGTYTFYTEGSAGDVSSITLKSGIIVGGTTT